MTPNVLVFEGTTLDDARKNLFTESPKGLFLQSQTEVAGRQITITAVANSAEDAFASALRQQPEGMRVLAKKETASARRTNLSIDAWDQGSADALLRKCVGPNSILESVREIQPPKAGFLGVGKAPGKYQGIMFHKASVEVQFGQPARIDATFGARIKNWVGLIHHLFSPGIKIIDELGERLGYQVLFILHERELAPAYYDKIPFSPVPSKTVDKCRSLVKNTKLPGMLGLFGAVAGASLASDRFELRSDGQIARKTNAFSDTAIVSVASCLPRGTVKLLGEDLGRMAFQAIEHYAKIPVVRYFLGLSFSQDILSKGPLSLEGNFEGRKYLGELLSGAESLLLEIYDHLPEGGLITDELVSETVRGFFDLK